MPFLKLACDCAYNTGAIRTHFPLTELVDRLRRAGIDARLDDCALEIDSDDDTFIFDDWQRAGLEQIGWLRFSTDGDISGVSRKLAKIGVRHRLELSRPRDLDTDNVRCVTRFEFRWEATGRRRAGQIAPAITTFDEAL